MFVSAFPVGLTTCRHIFVFRRKNFYSPYTIPQARDESKQNFRKIDFGNMRRYITQAVHMRKTQDAYLLSLPYRSHIVSQSVPNYFSLYCVSCPPSAQPPAVRYQIGCFQRQGKRDPIIRFANIQRQFIAIRHRIHIVQW